VCGSQFGAEEEAGLLNTNGGQGRVAVVGWTVLLKGRLLPR